jgi:hypothetical protein
VLFGALLACYGLKAQPIDSVHVFHKLPPGNYTSASANALAWQLHQSHAAHRAVKGTELKAAVEALQVYTPTRHTYGPLPGLTNVAIVHSGGRALAFGVADDLDLVVNFTARKEYRISSYVDHLSVRATLLKVLMTESW